MFIRPEIQKFCRYMESALADLESKGEHWRAVNPAQIFASLTQCIHQAQSRNTVRDWAKIADMAMFMAAHAKDGMTLEGPVLNVGDPVIVNNSRYRGPGIVRYFNQPSCTSVGVEIPNGQIWEYEVQTVKPAVDRFDEDTASEQMTLPFDQTQPTVARYTHPIQLAALHQSSP